MRDTEKTRQEPQRHRDTEISTIAKSVESRRGDDVNRIDVDVRPAADAVGRASNREERQKHKAHGANGLRFWRSSRFGARSAGPVARHGHTALCLRVSVALVFMLPAGCRSGSRDTPQEVVVWHQVGTWSGRANSQTETFTSDTGGFRVHWETRNETRPGEGRLKVVFRSGDSGREIVDAVDAHGIGRDTVEVSAERPRWYYLTIESANVDWSVRVDEQIRGEKKP